MFNSRKKAALYIRALVYYTLWTYYTCMHGAQSAHLLYAISIGHCRIIVSIINNYILFNSACMQLCVVQETMINYNYSYTCRTHLAIVF